MSAINETSQGKSKTLQDSTQNQTLGEYFESYMNKVRSGDLGVLPIIVGLVVIALIFQSQNENYLTPRNFVNLILQMAGITTIAFGIVYVLLLGEIDLSVGYVSAVAGVGMTIMLREPLGFPWYTAVPLALLVSAGIGLLQGFIITYFEVPSFIVTLAGLLAWNGVVLRIIGPGGTVIIQDDVVIGIANSYLPPVWGWIVGVGLAVVFMGVQIIQYMTRQRRGLSSRPALIIIVQIALVYALAIFVVAIANQDRGVPVVGLIILAFLYGLSYLATSTKFGRYVYAVGGNPEAARRAGINVQRIRVLCFMIASTMAGMGGIILASRLRSVDTGAGGGNLLLNSIAAAVIGGTSLFGGRGFVASAVWGALIIASVENGMGLLGLSSGNKFIITGLVLLAAVIVDAISRRRQKQSGIA